MSQPTASEPPSNEVVRTSDKQIFCCKSIDKLISDSEDPDRKLKKTLGPLSLTALGIGAVIGSGIFTVVGTAIAGQKFDTSSILNAPLLDYMVRHHATLGRHQAVPSSPQRSGDGAVPAVVAGATSLPAPPEALGVDAAALSL